MEKNLKKYILEAKNVKKSYGDTEVLKDISMKIKEGTVTGIIGPSGSGKSTLLRCLTLLDTFDRGELCYLGEEVPYLTENINKSKKIREIRKSFSLVFQNYNLFPHYSVEKNIIDAPIKVLGKNEEEAKANAINLLKKMGLEDKKDNMPCDLSGGQKQRVAIARALAMEPKILYFDEPTSALDPEISREVLGIIRELAEKNMTMIIVTHDISFARDVADHIVFMEKGIIIEEGSPKEVFENPKEERTKEFTQIMSSSFL